MKYIALCINKYQILQERIWTGEINSAQCKYTYNNQGKITTTYNNQIIKTIQIYKKLHVYKIYAMTLKSFNSQPNMNSSKFLVVHAIHVPR